MLPVRGWTGDSVLCRLEWEQLCFGEDIEVKASAVWEVTGWKKPGLGR